MREGAREGRNKGKEGGREREGGRQLTVVGMLSENVELVTAILIACKKRSPFNHISQTDIYSKRYSDKSREGFVCTVKEVLQK